MFRRLSVDELCKGDETCPSIWVDDRDPEKIVVVGLKHPHGIVPCGTDEGAVVLRRQVIIDAGIEPLS